MRILGWWRKAVGASAVVALVAGLAPVGAGQAGADQRVTTVRATKRSDNLVKNGTAEKGTGQEDYPDTPKSPPKWKTKGTNFTFHQYDGGTTSSNMNPLDSDEINGGSNFFAGGPSNAKSKAVQKTPIDFWHRAIDKGKVKAVLKAAMGGWSSQGDYSILKVVFLDEDGTKLGQLKRRGPTAAERGSETKWVNKKKKGPVPEGTRKIKIQMIAKRNAGSYNDGYLDNVRVLFRK